MHLRIAFENALEAADRATGVPEKLREAFKNQATASLEKLKEDRNQHEEEDDATPKGARGVLEAARAAFPAGSRHDACSSFSSKVTLEYGGADVGRIAVAAQVGGSRTTNSSVRKPSFLLHRSDSQHF